MKIIIVDSSNEREVLEINENEKIEKLREMIASKKGINTELKLHFNGELLEDENTISDYDISENDVIFYVGIFEAGLYFQNSFNNNLKYIHKAFETFLLIKLLNLKYTPQELHF